MVRLMEAEVLEMWSGVLEMWFVVLEEDGGMEWL